jgi:hypothetical protein
MFNYTVIDDVIPKKYQELIKHKLYSRDFSWFFVNDVTAKTSLLEEGRPANSHVFVRNGQKNSEFLDLISPIAYLATDHIGFDFDYINFARAFMQYPLSKEVIGNNNEMLDTFHVDNIEPHIVVLYYVNDSDGPTVILNKRYDNKSGSFPEEDLIASKDNILATVEPKQGRCIVFDGRLYHTATQPRNYMRTVINFNLHQEGLFND